MRTSWWPSPMAPRPRAHHAGSGLRRGLAVSTGSERRHCHSRSWPQRHTRRIAGACCRLPDRRENGKTRRHAVDRPAGAHPDPALRRSQGAALAHEIGSRCRYVRWGRWLGCVRHGAVYAVAQTHCNGLNGRGAQSPAFKPTVVPQVRIDFRIRMGRECKMSVPRWSLLRTPPGHVLISSSEAEQRTPNRTCSSKEQSPRASHCVIRKRR